MNTPCSKYSETASAVSEEGSGSDEVIFSIDISTIEASDSVESHRSAANSSKRLRISPGAYFAEYKDTLPHEADDTNQYQARTPKGSVFIQDSGVVLSSDRPGRQSYLKFVGKSVLLLYCFLSCVITTFRVYNLCDVSSSTRWQRQDHLPVVEDRTLANYLTRAISGPTYFEPFIISNEILGGNVSICAWLDESEIDFLESFGRHWQGPTSFLIITTAPRTSASHANLLRKIHSYSNLVGWSIHLLHIDATSAPSPNVYVNLAILMARTDWTLMFPSAISNSVPQGLQERLSLGKWETRKAPMVVASGSYSYPFPSLSPLLVRREMHFWCTERMFLDATRESDWDECLWQLTLEMSGKVDVLVLPTLKLAAGEPRPEGAEVGLSRQRLSTRFRAEMCDTVTKQLVTVHPRNRHRTMRAAWIKDFCTKTVDKKSA